MSRIYGRRSLGLPGPTAPEDQVTSFLYTSEHKRLPKIRGRAPGAGEGVYGGPDPDPYYLLTSCIRPRSHARLSLESDPVMAGSTGPGYSGFMPTSLDSSH